MTTTFELASSTENYLAYGVGRVADPYSVFNSLSRVRTAQASSVSHVISPLSDSAEISVTSSLVAAALSGSELRTEQIAALRESISNGSYRISSSSLARSVVDSLLAAR